MPKLSNPTMGAYVDNFFSGVQEGQDYQIREQQKQQEAIQTKGMFEKYRREEEDFIWQQQEREMSREDAAEILEITHNNEYSISEANDKLYAVRMRHASRQKDPVSAMAKVQQDYVDSQQDMDKLDKERIEFRQQTEEYKQQYEKYKAEEQKKKAEQYGKDKSTKQQTQTAAQKDAAAISDLINKRETDPNNFTEADQAALDRLQGKKSKASAIKSPTKAEVESIGELAQQNPEMEKLGDYADMEAGQKKIFQMQVASKAKMFQARDPELSWVDAVQMAINQEMGNVSEEGSLNPFKGFDKPAYRPSGQPQQAPANAAGTPQQSQQSPQQQLPTPKSKAEYDSIPAGQPYIDSNGRKRIKQ